MVNDLGLRPIYLLIKHIHNKELSLLNTPVTYIFDHFFGLHWQTYKYVSFCKKITILQKLTYSNIEYFKATTHQKQTPIYQYYILKIPTSEKIYYI